MQISVQETSPGAFTELAPGKGITAAGVNHPYQVVELWSEAELAEIGVYRVPLVVPDGKLLVSYEIERSGPNVIAVLSLEDAPSGSTGGTPPVLSATALTIGIDNSDIAVVDGMFNTAGAEYLGVGTYRIWFMNAQPDEAYFVTFSGGAPIMNAVNKTADYFEIEARATIGGPLVDASQFSVQVYRF